jgi:hypothetical protein
VPDLSTNACPVSIITPESMAMLQLIGRNRHVKEVGGSIFGDVSKLPARFVDAMELVQIERTTLDNLMSEVGDDDGQGS